MCLTKKSSDESVHDEPQPKELQKQYDLELGS